MLISVNFQIIDIECQVEKNEHFRHLLLFAFNQGFNHSSLSNKQSDSMIQLIRWFSNFWLSNFSAGEPPRSKRSKRSRCSKNSAAESFGGEIKPLKPYLPLVIYGANKRGGNRNDERGTQRPKYRKRPGDTTTGGKNLHSTSGEMGPSVSARKSFPSKGVG